MSATLLYINDQTDAIKRKEAVQQIVSDLQHTHGRLLTLTDILSFSDDNQYSLSCIADLYRPFLDDINHLLNNLEQIL